MNQNALSYDAVLLDLDGVLTSTAALHAACWKRTFDEVLADWRARTGLAQPPFDADRDYLDHVDGKPRADGVRDFLAARGVDVPAGRPDSPPHEWSVHGIANRKQRLVERVMERVGVEAFPGSVDFLHVLRALRVRSAVVSSSANCRGVLAAAGMDGLCNEIIDGHDVAELGLRGKPAPDSFLEAADRLGVVPGRAVVVEDALAGVAAGRAGGFGLVVGVARNGGADALRSAGADLVVTDLAELL